jgi:hypothetical protein
MACFLSRWQFVIVAAYGDCNSGVTPDKTIRTWVKQLMTWWKIRQYFIFNM